MIGARDSVAVIAGLPPGGFLLENFLNREEEGEIMETLEGNPWGGNGVEPNAELKRRTQHYGFLFSYRYRRVLERLKEMPPPLQQLADRIKSSAGVQDFGEPFNSVIVNEYERGQGIMPHVDSPELFGPVVASVSMLSDCLMTFSPASSLSPGDQQAWYEALLPQRSCLLLTGDARYLYKHSISKSAVETTVDGTTVNRERRVSLTFRCIVQKAQPVR